MPQANPTRILSLQSFYGGSHKQFNDGWIENSSFSWQLLQLPARHWKWRMRHAAIDFAAEVDRLYSTGVRWDMLVCSDMLNLAEFKGLLQTSAREIPTLAYFHENQFEYPNQVGQERDFHFGFTNFTTALAADLLWFNSQFNRDSMLGHLRTLCSKWPDYVPLAQIETIAAKACIESPGVNVVASAHTQFGNPIHIVWAARWEHDKNPEQLREILSELNSQNVKFQLSVIGQQFSKVPQEFEMISRQCRHQIRHWGFQASREDYLQVLTEADLFLSTAFHEFFGLSTVEAICSGCLPLLPNRLVYPELIRAGKIPDRKVFLYETTANAVDFIKSFNQSGRSARVKDLKLKDLRLELTNEFQTRYTWSKRAAAMDGAITEYLQST